MQNKELGSSERRTVVTTDAFLETPAQFTHSWAHTIEERCKAHQHPLHVHLHDRNFGHYAEDAAEGNSMLCSDYTWGLISSVPPSPPLGCRGTSVASRARKRPNGRKRIRQAYATIDGIGVSNYPKKKNGARCASSNHRCCHHRP